MNATKRKFNALLQGIGARPNSQLSEKDSLNAPRQDSTLAFSSPTERPSVSDTTTPSEMTTTLSSPSADFLKRRRVGVLEATTANQKSKGTTISNVILRKWTPGNSPSTGRKKAPMEPPKYSPSDRDELIRRLGTFQELTEWTPKPDRVNEIEWAKRGWICGGKERVRCELCNKELVVKTSKREVEGKEVSVAVGSEIEEGLVKKYAGLIVEAHQDECPWRKHGCDDTLLRLSLANPHTALTSLRERYDDLCSRPSFLPYLFNLRLPENLDLETAKSQLPPNFFTEPPPPSSNPQKPNDVALALAMTGWQGLTNPRIGAVPNSAACGTCLRRLGLWMFKSKEVEEATGQILVPAPMDHLDPIREHRFFCPWRNAAAQHNPGSKSKDQKTAWDVLAQTLKNNAYLRKQAEKSNQRSSHILHRATGSTPATPSKGGNDGDVPLVMLGPDMVDDEDEDTSVRDAKDKERWARLRRVKSLFDTKNGKKLRRTLSRPGTGSTNRPPTGHSRKDSETGTIAGDK
ncbi:zf-C3HC-domain-containing protein [Xylariaceae sp. FL0016]|nr:zf-C3HC-domain-containing protein [Xylariaceae sp. FL0016]